MRSAWTTQVGEAVPELEGLTPELVKEALKDFKHKPSDETRRRLEAFKRTMRKPHHHIWLD